MYSTTGFSRDRILDLCAMIHAQALAGKRPWPPILGLHKSVVVALTYMRRNRVLEELAETCGGVPAYDQPRDHRRDASARSGAHGIRSDG
jgi:hypothetical protein